MKILAIETSHDDTSVALYQNNKILKEVTISQTEFHKKYGGTVPEYASRHHSIALGKILDEIQQKYKLHDIDHVAYTALPGLIGSLHMGRLFAYGVAHALDKRIFPINHIFAHIYSVAFTHEIKYPAIALIVSGGHTQIWKVNGPNDINILNETKDDAVGEVYDKIARKMNLGFPGGPIIDKLAREYKGDELDFSLNLNGKSSFSFSGLKTKVINKIHNLQQNNLNIDKKQIAYSFQKYVVKNLIDKTKLYIDELNPNSIILGGGVAANSLLRKEFEKLHSSSLIPEMKYTGDNASMIAIRSAILNKKNTI